MTLNQAIEHALALTRALQDALDEDDLDRALDLVPERGRALEKFQAAHEAATEAQKLACRKDLVTLRNLDETLQETAGARLDDAARRLTSGSAPNRTRQEPCLSGCLDRHA